MKGGSDIAIATDVALKKTTKRINNNTLSFQSYTFANKLLYQFQFLPSLNPTECKSNGRNGTNT